MNKSQKIKEEIEENSNILRLGLFHRKSNNDRLRSPIALRFFFYPDYVDFDYDSLAHWESELSTPQQILRLLDDGPKDFKTIKEELGIDREVAKKALYRLSKIQHKIDNLGGFWTKL